MSLVVDIEKQLGDFRLKVSFEAGSGLPMALLGASGCGKSVTLKCISGLMQPDKGSITLDGRTLFSSEKRISLPPQQRKVGYLFQNYALFPNMTLEGNIRCLPGQTAATVRDVLDRFHLTGLEKLYPHQLSGGQQQRAALARILASNPHAILLDEPLSAQDSYLAWELEQELWELLRPFEGPVIWVSHNIGECRRNCGSVCVMDGGTSSPVLPMEQLISSPRTISQARLAGCRCFVAARPCEGGVLIPPWNIKLNTIPPGNFDLLGIPGGAELDDSGFPCTVVRIVRDERAMALLLPEGAAEDAPLLLCALNGRIPKIGEKVRAAINGRLLYLS